MAIPTQELSLGLPSVFLVAITVLYRDNMPDAERDSIQLEVQHVFSHRHQITEEAENLDNREPSEVRVKTFLP